MAGETILIIEDEPGQRQLLGVLLQDHGYRVVLAGNAEEGLQRVRADPPPALVLLDMMGQPPGRDGWFFLQQLRRNPALAGLPVFIVTGLGNASEEWAVGLGAAGLIRKPVALSELLGVVRAALEGPRDLPG